MNTRTKELDRFYELIDELRIRCGGTRILAECNGRMSWPSAWPRMMTRAEQSRSSPRIGRSLALSRPWSHSTRLFAYCSVL